MSNAGRTDTISAAGHRAVTAGLAGAMDWRGVAIAVAPRWRWFRFERHVIEVILVSALLGVVAATT
jgi:hypothetical protein